MILVRLAHRPFSFVLEALRRSAIIKVTNIRHRFWLHMTDYVTNIALPANNTNILSRNYSSTRQVALKTYSDRLRSLYFGTLVLDLYPYFLVFLKFGPEFSFNFILYPSWAISRKNNQILLSTRYPYTSYVWSAYPSFPPLFHYIRQWGRPTVHKITFKINHLANKTSAKYWFI